jgi:nucleotide-binding universal stress UspA family protein
MFDKILIAHDGSDGANKAFDIAVNLASTLQAKLHMISVEEDLPRHAEIMEELIEVKEREDSYYGQLAAQCKRRAALHSVNLTSSILPGHEVKTIVDFLGQGGFDLLIIGFTGHSRIYEHIWGGTSHNLTSLAPCSVLVVK